MNISFSFHLFNFKFTLYGKTFEYHSHGGPFLWLGLIAGFGANYLGYTNFNPWLILGVSIGACLLWDFLTMAIFFLRCLMHVITCTRSSPE